MLSPGAVFSTIAGEVRVVRFLGRGKSGYSHLVVRDGEALVLKLMHDEPVAYYAFGGDKVGLEVGAYAQLQALGVNVPVLLEHCAERRYLLKRFADGPTASEVIAGGALQDETVGTLLGWSRRLRDAGFNLDWFPSNFVVTPDAVVYVDYEINPHDERWSFERWGACYWANAAGMRGFLDTGDASHINEDPLTGQPRVSVEARRRIDAWLERHS